MSKIFWLSRISTTLQSAIRSIWLFGCIIWQMHLDYVRLYNLPVCVREYFTTWRLIHWPEEWELANGDIAHRRTVAIWAIRGTCLAAMTRNVQVAISMIPALPLHWRILLWDQMHFLDASPEFNLIYVFITPFCVSYYYRFYFYSPKKRATQLESIRLAYMMLYEAGDPRYRDQRSLMYVDAAKIRSVTKKNLTWMQYYNLYMELAYVNYLIAVVQYIWKHFKYFSTTAAGYASLLVILLNYSFTSLFISMLMMEYVQLTVVGLVNTLVTFWRLRQISNLLCPGQRGPFPASRICTFTRYHTRLLLDIGEGNRLVGPVLLTYMIAAVPTSAYQVVLLSTRRLSTMTVVSFANILFYQSVVILGFHLVAAMYSERIHRCSRRLNQLSASMSVSIKGHRSLGFQLKLAQYIAKFHTDHKYGITYSAYGLVSFASFFKFTLCYSELVMFLIKRLHK